MALEIMLQTKNIYDEKNCVIFTRVSKNAVIEPCLLKRVNRKKFELYYLFSIDEKSVAIQRFSGPLKELRKEYPNINWDHLLKEKPISMHYTKKSKNKK